MKQSKKIIKWINTGIFPAGIMLSVGFNYDEICGHLKKVGATGWQQAISQDRQLIESSAHSGLALKRTVTNIKIKTEVTYFLLIFRKPFDFSDYSYCSLAHEILHICQFMLPDILDRNREWECEAYLHTHIMQQVLKELRK